MEINKKCIQCGETEKLFELNSGACICKKCSDALGEEEKEIEDYISNYLSENWQISNPGHQANVLISIAMNIKMNNNLLNEEDKNKILEIRERMEKAFE